MKNKSTTSPLKLITKTFSRYNLVIFIVITSIGLILSILLLNNLVLKSYDDSSLSATNDSTNSNSVFDQLTITRLTNLNSSANNLGYDTLPSGRINPFSE